MLSIQQQKQATVRLLPLAGLLLLFSTTTALAQIRVYDEKSGISAAAPTVGGLTLGVGEPAPNTPKSDNKVTPASQMVSSTKGPIMPVASGVRTAPLGVASPPLPPTPATPPQAAQPVKIMPTVQKTDDMAQTAPEVFVFTKVSEFSPIVVARIKEIRAIPGLNPIFYLDDHDPKEYMSLGDKGFDKIPEDLDFTVDDEGAIAEAYGVNKANVIIVRFPNGAIRSYNLITDVELFKSHMQRANGGGAT